MERWLLISNCQTFGLVQCLHMLDPELVVDGLDLGQFHADTGGICDAMERYDRVVLHPEAVHVPGFDASRAAALTYLPSLAFEAYHPDNCYAECAGRRVMGPLADYQSHLMLAAYVAGLGVEDTLRLFRGDVFERCGYFDLWQSERARLLSAFERADLDIGDLFLRWARSPLPFMYSINHPRLGALNDLARLFLKAMGRMPLDTNVLAPDNLSLAACWPVYPEIGEALGIAGSYAFKVHDQARHMDLPTFLAASFAAFEQHDRATLTVQGYNRPQFERVLSVVRSEA